MKPGNFDSKMVWLFMLGGVAIASGLAFASVGGAAITAAIFTVFGFLSTFLTRAGKGLAFGAWFLGSLLTAVATFVAVMMVTDAAAAEAMAGSDLDQTGAAVASAGASALGGAIGVFGAVSAFFVALVPSVAGLFVGASVRGKAAPALA